MNIIICQLPFHRIDTHRPCDDLDLRSTRGREFVKLVREMLRIELNDDPVTSFSQSPSGPTKHDTFRFIYRNVE